MRKYIVKTCYTFNVTFEVLAENTQDAIQKVYDSCGALVSVHSSLPDGEIDYEYDNHAEEMDVISTRLSYVPKKKKYKGYDIVSLKCDDERSKWIVYDNDGTGIEFKYLYLAKCYIEKMINHKKK